MVNRQNFFLVGCILIAGSVSCRSKCSCIAAPGLNPSLISLGASIADTIILKKFSKGSGFGSFLDSTLIDRSNSLYQTHQDTTDLMIYNAALYSSYDYEILFPPSGLVIKITGIDESHTEGTCPDKTQCVDPINSYEINDSLITRDDPYGNRIYILIP
jgi:hypothetical protein